MSSGNTTRLNKYISESGICSRREADRFIESGQVFINGRRAKVGDQVPAGAVVKVNGIAIEPRKKDDFILIAFNKPVGVTTTTEEGVRNNIVDYVNHSARLFPIGRLDKDSQGLIFLTNNGDIVNKILRAGNNHEKEYVVTVNKPITDDFIQGMAGGVPILGTMTKKCKVRKEAAFVFNIILVQGLNRQIRRMCEHFGYEVVKLERIRIMHIGLKGVPPGEWRDLNRPEMAELIRLLEHSESEDLKKNSGHPKKSTSQKGQGSNQGKSKDSQKKQKSHPGKKASSSHPPHSKPGGRNHPKGNHRKKRR